ncbi:hypothetical protein FACS1894167_13990 [Synergistales bacterium]|nr:hypothetical protein FACS1894167_13990 [Synergistales bacterium]
MITWAILLGVAAVGFLLATFWEEVRTWLIRGWEELKKISEIVVAGVKTFAVRLADGIGNIAKYYSRNKITNEWEETVTRKKVNESDVPPDLVARFKGSTVEVETTDLLELALAG